MTPSVQKHDDARLFLENDNGVHGMSTIGLGEFTICGWAFDAPETEGLEEVPGGSFRETKKKTITCPQCIEVLDYYSRFRTRRIQK